jgi:hypothetical protein
LMKLRRESLFSRNCEARSTIAVTVASLPEST